MNTPIARTKTSVQKLKGCRHTRFGSRPRGHARRNGQAIVETGFVIIGLLALSMGLLQIGIIYSASLTLTNLTREAARFAAVHGTVPMPSLRDQVIAELRRKAQGTTINPNDLHNSSVQVIVPTPPPGQTVTGRPVRVEVNYDMRKKFFLPASFPGLSSPRFSNFRTTAQMVIE